MGLHEPKSPQSHPTSDLLYRAYAMTWNWQAHTALAITAAAIANFLVAVIAVYPIFGERKRRRVLWR